MKKHHSFTKETQKIHLTAEERRLLRSELVSYMEYHPLRMPQPARRATPARRAAFSFRLATYARPLMGAMAAFFFVVVPLAAEEALPGDMLYPVKVKVNEELRAQLALSPFEKIQWEAERVERRVSEARQLAAEGRLSAEAEDALGATVREHTAEFENQLAELRVQDAAGAAVAEVTFGSALEVQSLVLDADQGVAASSTAFAKQPETGLAAAVREAREHVASSTREEGSAPSYDRLMARIEENTTRIHALAAGLAKGIAEDERTKVDERIVRINENIVAARSAHDAGDLETATALLRETLARSQKIIAFMSSVELRGRVSLDRLVPNEVTDEERARGLAETLEVFTSKRAILADGVAVLTEPLKGEMESTLVSLDEALAQMESEIAAGQLTEAQETALIAADLLATLDASLVASSTPPVEVVE